MGWTVLYIAFGIVALWLLGEVLLQYKARLRWRLLAFVGFLGVVLGVLMPSVVVIGIGAIAFAVGQTYVTLSFRRGFSTGWALKGVPVVGKSRTEDPPSRQEPTLEVSGLEAEEPAEHGFGYTDADAPAPAQADEGAFAYAYTGDGTYQQPGDGTYRQGDDANVYEPQPMPEDTGQYGVYSGSASAYEPAAAAQHTAGYGYEGYAGYGQQQYDTYGGQQQYTGYSDPYAATGTYGGQQQYDAYGQQQYGQGAQGGYPQDPYAASGYGTETPPGGVWVPQQRDGDQQQYSGELPPEQAYPHQDQGGYDTGYNQQYRY
ncbi:SCO2102 family sporulation regulator [Streptomyces sp. NPDC002577]